MKPEIWAPIPGTNGKYEASSHGRFRRVKTGQILKTRTTSEKQVVITLWVSPLPHERQTGAKARTFRVPRLIWLSLCGPLPEGYDVTTKNGSYEDLSLENLVALPSRERRRLSMQNKGQWLKHHVLTEDEVREIRRLADLGETPKELAKKFSIGRTAVNDVIKRRRWKSI